MKYDIPSLQTQNVAITMYCCVVVKPLTYLSVVTSDSSLIRKTPELTRGPVRSNLLRKAKKKSLRMSIVIVLAFIICWTPYYVIFISVTFFKWEEIEPKTMLWFFFIGMTNTMLNPMIYGAFQLCKVHRPRLVEEPCVKRMLMSCYVKLQVAVHMLRCIFISEVDVVVF